jgi:hypothetical protein
MVESTLRDIISTVRSSHKLFSTDSILNDRAIAAEIKTSTFLLIKRETNNRKLWATDTLFTTIPCLELQEVPISECCEFTDECTVARTKIKLPRISEGNYQYLIQGVYSINALGGRGKKLKEITVNRYINLLKLPIIKQEEYYFIVNDYLYVTNPNILAVRIAAFFEDDIPNDVMFSECSCGTSFTTEDYCKNPLDRKFGLPGYLKKQVLDLTSQRLLNTYFRIKTDITSDGVDGQAPNTKPTN